MCLPAGSFAGVWLERHHNDAYIVITGEDTAHDVFADTIARSWIDQPAHACQAELAGSSRPGTLPAREVQSLLDHQARLAATLHQLRTDLKDLPRQHQSARHGRDQTAKQLEASTAGLQAAHDTITQRDRPFHRRGHENDIRDAHIAIAVLPAQIRTQTGHIEQLADKIDNIDSRPDQAEQLGQQRPALETQLADIDSRLDDHRRIRTRQIRRDPPERITDTLAADPTASTHPEPGTTPPDNSTDTKPPTASPKASAPRANRDSPTASSTAEPSPNTPSTNSTSRSPDNNSRHVRSKDRESESETDAAKPPGGRGSTKYVHPARRRGRVCPDFVLSDNGMYYTARFAGGGRTSRNRFETLLNDLGVNQKHSRPNHPTTCGKVERFQQTLKKWLRPKPPAASIGDLQTLLDEFVDEYNHRRPHRSLGRTTPRIAYTRLPKTGPATTPETEHRIRRDKVDQSGKVTLRHNTHLYKIGIGRAHARTPIIMLIAGLEIRVVAAQTGELLRHLTLDIDRTYQPTGKPRNPRT